MILGRLSSLSLGLCLFSHVVAQDSSPGGSVHPGQPSDCNAWHTIVDGDNCDSVPKLFGITREQFLKWNPAVSSDCLTNFWLGYAYCVGVGPRKTTSGLSGTTSSSSPVPTTSATMSSTPVSVNTTYSIREPVISWNISSSVTDGTWPPKITQAGQPEACNRWHLVSAGQTCQTIVNRYRADLTSEQL